MTLKIAKKKKSPQVWVSYDRIGPEIEEPNSSSLLANGIPTQHMPCHVSKLSTGATACPPRGPAPKTPELSYGCSKAEVRPLQVT